MLGHGILNLDIFLHDAKGLMAGEALERNQIGAIPRACRDRSASQTVSAEIARQSRVRAPLLDDPCYRPVRQRLSAHRRQGRGLTGLGRWR